MGAEGKSGEFSDLFGGALGKFEMRIQSRSPRRPAKRQVEEVVEGLLQTLDVALQQAGPATELLTKRQRHGVLQVRAPNLDYVIEFPGLGHDRVWTLRIAGISAFFTRSAAAMCIAVGNVSFDD